MSRRDQWKEVKDTMFGQAAMAKSVQERETIPEKACGICRQFSENAYSSDGRGSCKIFKIGSDITRTPPVLVAEGANGYITFFNTNAAQCPRFEKMKMIDKDGHECADPEFRRAQRQMEKL